ncbi:MAG: type ISP restriction/modification enzyme [Candidatus Saccharimonadaceae bacterium]
MNETDRVSAVAAYIDELTEQLRSGHAREHAYRPALERFMASFNDVIAVNDPRRSENGNPDFVFLKKTNVDVILGYAEAKDITIDLDKTLKTEQLRRYAGYEKLFLTNYRDFIFLASGEEYLRISIGSLENGVFTSNQEQALRLVHELRSFLERKPEAIRSGKRLAVIMGGKARRIRDNVNEYLANTDNERNSELDKIYGLMKSLLVHDLTKEQFADLYAQTLVYGLFAARYDDETPENFDRREAVENVPKTNPFLRQFFNHIAGADFDARLRYIVDELCEVFSISDIRGLVRFQATKFAVDDERDLTIHFYEDFLKEYDPVMRQRMGVYYTPVPVVRYIVQSVDRILKEEFGISKGLASSDTIDHWIETGQDHRSDRRQKAQTGYYKKIPRVQVLDPAVGTATFLNETIKHIYKDFEGQEGRWPAYVRDNLVKRLHGFELMMAPYTIAHLKLSMTLKETGAGEVGERLGVYLTNTLEEGLPSQGDLFTLFGLAEAVSEESRHASEIKNNQPIMVVMGNPPYSSSSNNKGIYIQELVKVYKKGLNERKINLDDDYIKFIRFAENMIFKNGSGIVAMITNNSYLDGMTHRQMRKHLLQTFDKIYIMDLHGDVKKGDGDENVFEIMQGVSIVLMIKSSTEGSQLGEIHYGDIRGKRKYKFQKLNEGVKFTKLTPSEPNYFFTPKDFSKQSEYDQFIHIDSLMPLYNSGIQTKNDALTLQESKSAIEHVVDDFNQLSEDEIKTKYSIKNGGVWTVELAKKSVMNGGAFSEILYRPFDTKWTYLTRGSGGFIGRPREKTVKHFVGYENIGINLNRQHVNDKFSHVLVTDKPTAHGTFYLGNRGQDYLFPLYLYHDDGTRTDNFDPSELAKLTNKLTVSTSSEDVLDYIYAVLHSPEYRIKYKEFLKIDFPRIPIPTQPEFDRLVPLGRELRKVHLMKLNTTYDTTFPQGGDNVVDKPLYMDGRVYINSVQYFGNVPETAWSFYIGGYQPAQKWLKDRKGRTLSNDELDHYQDLVKVLLETSRIMSEIG